MFQTAPEQVAILIDGGDRRTISSGDTITINPGKHTLIIFRNEFNPDTEYINIKNGETQDITAALLPLTDAAKSLLNNDVSNTVIEKSTAITKSKQVELTKKLNPITSILPITNNSYNISSCPSELYPNDQNKIALCVDIPSEEYKVYVQNDIKSHGFNPDQFEYIWNIYLDSPDSSGV